MQFGMSPVIGVSNRLLGAPRRVAGNEMSGPKFAAGKMDQWLKHHADEIQQHHDNTKTKEGWDKEYALLAKKSRQLEVLQSKVLPDMTGQDLYDYMKSQQFSFIDDDDIGRTFGPHAGAVRAGLQALISVDLMAQGMEYDMTDTKRYGVYTTRPPV